MTVKQQGSSVRQLRWRAFVSSALLAWPAAGLAQSSQPGVAPIPEQDSAESSGHYTPAKTGSALEFAPLQLSMFVDAYARLLTEPSAIGGTFNICSGKAVSLREVIDLVEALSGNSFEVKVNPAFVREKEVVSLCGSPARVEATIGPLNHIPLEDTLRWMLEA